MTAPPPPIKDALAFYLDLAVRIRAERPAIETIIEMVRRALATHLLTPADIECLRAKAEDHIWYSPRSGWALAHIAYVASGEHANLNAKSALTLGVASSALGDFAGTIPLLQDAEQYFLSRAQPGHAARCACELAALYAEMGELDRSEAVLDRARVHAAGVDDPLPSAYYTRAEGQFYFEKNRHADAVAAFRRAAEAFATLDLAGETAVTYCRLAEAMRYVDTKEALLWVEKARSISIAGEGTVHLARCDYTVAWIYDELNRFADSLQLFRQSQAVFAQEGMTHLVNLCDLYQGIAYYRLDQFDEAMKACTLARAAFAVQGLNSHVDRCDFNLAAIYYSLNRYDEALALYGQVAKSAVAEARILRAARCYANIGLCYDQFGRYDKALDMHARARQNFLNIGNPISAARCQEHIARSYRRLGRYSEALQHFQKAREVFVHHQLPIDTAWCDLYMADLHLAMGNNQEALVCLARAHSAFEQGSIPVQAAACDREMARAFARLRQAGEAHAALDKAQAVFQANGLLVDAALCALARGEAYLDQAMLEEAVRCFKAALGTLQPGFPDEAWRAEYGLGQCALIAENRQQAFEHWLSAVRLIHPMRAALPTERLSGGFFVDRRELYEAALALAVTLDQPESALAIAEAAKAQAFLNSAGSFPRDSVPDDPYQARLRDHEAQLRREIAALRDQLRLIHPDPGGPILRGVDEVRSDQPEALSQLTQLAREYETVVEQLRLATPGRPDTFSSHLFSIEALRDAAQARLPAHWACLAYYVLGAQLVVFYLDAARLICRVKPLERYDRRILEQCTDLDPDVRDLIYGDAGHGQAQLRHLHDLLIPPEAEALGADDVLIVAPHAQLHRLPFHALRGEDGALTDQVPTIVVPSLSALEALLQRSGARQGIEHVLAIGVSDFGKRARRLLDAREEIEMVRNIFGRRVKVLWETEVTRESLLRLQRAGELAGYDVVHFATHARLDHTAPSQSGILLYDDNLVFADILTLTLQAKLVVLASCEGAIGKSYGGDEIMGLAQAFFHAGTQTVVASLWPVEDASTRELMNRLYRHRAAGANVARALRSAQHEMRAAGYAPYHWAPFVAIGLP